MASDKTTTDMGEEVVALQRELSASRTRHVESVMEEFLDLWVEIGLTSEQIRARLTYASDAICDHATNLIESERKMKKDLEERVADLRRKVADLCAELRKTHVALDTSGLTLRESEQALQEECAGLYAEKEERLRKLKMELDEEAALCAIMESPRLGLDPDRVPSAQDMAEIRDQIIYLRDLQEKRMNRFRELRAGVMAGLEALGRGPDTTLAVDVVSENEETCPLGKTRMDALENYHAQVRAELDQRKHQVARLRDTMEALWDRLDIGDEERELFHVPEELTDHVVDLLKREIERLNELKLEHIEQFIDKCRAEIKVKWDKCFLSLEQRAEFTPFHSEAYSEELLLMHEREAQRLADYMERNKDLLQHITRWETMWARREELRDAEHDPNRYNNRGCNLLQEERENNRIKIQLPKLESKIAQDCDEYQARTGEPFLFRGLPFLDYIKMTYDQADAERIAKRDARTKAKDAENRKEAIYGTNMKKVADRTPLKQKKLEMTHSTARFKTPAAPPAARPSVKKTADRPTLARDRPTLTRDRPTLTRDKATLKRRAVAGPSGESTNKAVRRNILGDSNIGGPAAATNYLPRAAAQSPGGLDRFDLSRASETGDYDAFARTLHQRGKENPGLASSYLHVPK